MSSTAIVLQFMVYLAEIRGQFGRAHLFAEQSEALRDVSTMVIPSVGENSEYAENGAVISIALNAELRKPIDSERQAIGMSLLLRHSAREWIVEAEVGWTGQMVGWDPVDSRDARAQSIEEVFIVSPQLVEWLDTRFRAEVGRLSQ